MMSVVGLLGALSGVAQAAEEGEHHPFSWYQLLPGFGPESSVGKMLGLHEAGEAFLIPTVWGLVIFLLVLALVARAGLNSALAKGGSAAYVPDAGLTVRNAFEVVIEWLHDLVHGLIGKETAAFFPLIATIFIYVLACNLSGFIPGHLPPTDNFSHNLALSLCVFVVFNWAGFTRAGFGYIKHMMGPIAALAPAFLVLETISLFIRPVSLTVRLTVNIFVDHLLQEIARGLGDSFLGIIGSAVLPVPIYFLGLLVCVVQAFVFALLTTIYISLSVAHGDGHDHDHAHAGAH